jgi:tRNA threonylcarbamoyl adenosine modification protein YjeE
MSLTWTGELDLAGVIRFAELLALKLKPGDVVALSGELGAGKTTFARALIRALLQDEAAEVPSPTFSLQQTYETSRFTVAHFDLYRLSDADDAHELGLNELRDEVAIIEWSERLSDLPPEARFNILLEDTGEPDTRLLTLRGHGAAAARAARIAQIAEFLERQPAWESANVAYLQGDASSRAYARLRGGERYAVLMDAPRQPDGPPIRDGKPYSRIAHLAEDMVRPFSALSRALREAGLSAPEILAEDQARGLLLIEDLGDRVFGTELARDPMRQSNLWRTAVDALVVLRQAPAIQELVSRRSVNAVTLPSYDREALQIEAELLLDWYWVALHDTPATIDVRAEFLALWQPLFQSLERQPPSLVLRDYHSPNLIWLPEREGVRKVGIIDFQDAQIGPAAYDLVSLLQDARVDVPEALENELFEHYLRAAKVRDPKEFQIAYNTLGVQRNTKILGIFVRLARRDGKRSYLAHLPRIWGYLQRNLTNAALAPLAAWYERHFPVSSRGKLPF